MLMPGVVVVIPNWNGAQLLEQFLPSVFQQTIPVRVVVVDNGSTDESVGVARRLGAEVIAMGANRGFAAAVNRGIAETEEPFIAIVNNDARLAPDWLERLMQAMEETGAHLATGRILNERETARLDGTYDLLSRGATACRAGAGTPDANFPHTRRRVGFISLTAALVRREAFERAGALDEDFESYLEDVEFSLRCARLGMAGVYEPAAAAWHRGSATLGAWHAETTRRIARNQVMLVAKHYPRGWFGEFGAAVWVGQLLWGLVACRHGAGLAYWRGKWQGLRGYAGWRAGSPWHTRRDDLNLLLGLAEMEIARLQAQTGWQRYWRWYFRLAGRAEAK